MNGNELARLSASPDAIRNPNFFAQPPWTVDSPEWIALDREIEPDHPVRLLARLVEEELRLEDLQATYSGRGSRPHRPDLLLKLLTYEHSQGQTQPVSRRVGTHRSQGEQACPVADVWDQASIDDPLRIPRSDAIPARRDLPSSTTKLSERRSTKDTPMPPVHLWMELSSRPTPHGIAC
jgi:hypothetical protein